MQSSARSLTEYRGDNVLKVKVLVANQPRLMRELVLDTIAGHEDIEVVGEVVDEKLIFEKVEEVRPDFLIMTLQRSEERPSLCDLLWERFPRLKVLALQAESNDSILYWVTFNLSANRIETSEKGILDALRSGTVSREPQEPELSPKVN
jgi:chemotaxis response regulator CheB